MSLHDKSSQDILTELGNTVASHPSCAAILDVAADDLVNIFHPVIYLLPFLVPRLQCASVHEENLQLTPLIYIPALHFISMKKPAAIIL